MILHRGLGLLVLGVASYALYKTGAFVGAKKAAVKASAKVSDWTSEKIAQIKDCDCLKKKEAEPAEESK